MVVITKITEDQYEVEIDVDADAGTVKLVGEISNAVSEGDKYSAVKITFAADVKLVEYTRTDVLAALYKNVSITARVYGPTSDEVEDLEDDIADVKNGGDLAPYAWMFEKE